MSTFALWRLFHRPGSRGSAGHTSVLAIIAFAAATTIFLTVLGGVHGFMWRASADHTIGCAINLDACKPGTAETVGRGHGDFVAVELHAHAGQPSRYPRFPCGPVFRGVVRP